MRIEPIKHGQLAKRMDDASQRAANLSAKSVWRFEPVEALSGGVVAFESKVRIKHVATNKFLAVSLEAARRCSSEDEGGAGIKFDVLERYLTSNPCARHTHSH